jgi:drug/metabolite transporter (DMT)-like permease
MLMMSLSPILTALLAWVFLGEHLTMIQLLGISITLAGIIWVVLERNNNQSEPANHRHYRLGLAAGLGAAVCQSVGLILAHQGMAGDFPVFSGNFIRMSAAAVTLWSVTVLQGQTRSTIRTLEAHPKAVGFAFLGAVTGPFLGVSLSLLAIQHTDVGVASTLMALPPVLLLPVSYFLYKERIGWQAITGTILAMAGIALLFMV